MSAMPREPSLRMRRMFHSLRLVLCLMGLAVPVTMGLAPLSVAWAQSSDAEEHFRRGKELYDEGDFQASLIEFQRAYAADPNFNVLFNIGQVQYQLGDYASAKETLEQYLRDGGSGVGPDRSEAVQNDIARLSQRVATVTVNVNVPGATVSVDDVVRGDTPLEGPLTISAGRRRVKARKDGYVDAEKVVDVAGGDEVEVTLQLGELGGGTTIVPGADEEKDADANTPWAAWTATAALGAGSLVFGLLALSTNSQLDDELGEPATIDEVNEIRTRLIAFSIVTDVMLVGTAIAGGVAIYLTLTDEEDPEGGEVSLGLGPGSMYLNGTF